MMMIVVWFVTIKKVAKAPNITILSHKKTSKIIPNQKTAAHTQIVALIKDA